MYISYSILLEEIEALFLERFLKKIKIYLMFSAGNLKDSLSEFGFSVGANRVFLSGEVGKYKCGIWNHNP